MTTPNEIESDLEDLKEGTLGSLSPAERARAVVRYRAAGKDDVVDTLRETAPVNSYEATDLEFLDTLREYTTEALYALWELETAAWRFLYEARARASPETDILEEDETGDAERIAAELLADYRAWSRYATEDVGVSLREFLLHPLHPEGGTHVDRVEYAAALADGTAFDEDGLGWAAATVTVGGEEYGVGDLAEWKYEQITAGAGGPA